MGTSLNAFINVHLRIYFIALYVNLVELHSDYNDFFYIIIPHFQFSQINEQINQKSVD